MKVHLDDMIGVADALIGKTIISAFSTGSRWIEVDFDDGTTVRLTAEDATIVLDVKERP